MVFFVNLAFLIIWAVFSQTLVEGFFIIRGFF